MNIAVLILVLASLVVAAAVVIEANRAQRAESRKVFAAASAELASVYEQSRARELELLDRAHLRTMEWAHRIEAFLTTQVQVLNDAALRESTDTRLVLEALTADRARLLTAAIAAHNPAAANALAQVDRSMAHLSSEERVRAIYENTLEREARAGVNEFVTPGGEPIMPVGME